MNDELRRYLDGDLTEDEAQRFLSTLEQEPRLEAELHQMETLLSVGRSLIDTRFPDGFTEQVIERVDRPPDARSFPRARWWVPALSVAAAVLFFFAGMQVGRQPDPQPATIPTGVEAGTAPRLRSVRLVYVPTDAESVERVHVAGDFNAWDASVTPLRRQGDAWVTTLVLPEGEYEYMFVENDQRWVTDPLAQRTREDGFGGSNGVLDIGI